MTQSKDKTKYNTTQHREL